MAGEVKQILEYAVNEGFLTQEQIEECAKIQNAVKALGLNKTLIQVIFEKDYLSRKHLNQIKTELNLPIAEIGNYGILSQLGKGGMGTVYKAQRLSDGKFVAIKLLSERIKDKKHIERFQREIAAGSELIHPNIVNIIDSGIEKNNHFLVMEYIEGRNLEWIIEKEGAIPEPQAVEITIQIADALNYASQKGLVHRDIKPANIIITSNGTAKLCDFGIVKFTTKEFRTLTMEGTSLSTPQYASPEQASGEEDIDIRSDLYSLGVTLYNMVTGKVPFEGKEGSAILLKHINNLPLNPQKINPELSNEITKTILKLMQKKPVNRYLTPNDLIIALKNIGHKRLIYSKVKLEQLNPDNAETYIIEGNEKYKIGDHKGAIADYNKAIELNPQNSEAYHNRGDTKYKIGDHKGAMADYDKVIELNPNLAEVYYGRGDAKYMLGDYNGAIADYDKAISINPNYALAYYNRGNAKYRIGNYKDAIADCDKAININPNYMEAYITSGNARYRLDDHKGSISNYDKVIELNPKNAEAYRRRGDSKYTLGNYEGAIADWGKAVELKPKYKDEIEQWINQARMKVEQTPASHLKMKN